ncbi:Actin-related protein 5 [Komagataella phaffii CBS 7435]|uniref:Actin-related protein 5 n=1 Tax=Komagataella phaffii (strain ATCC 76273 / CBS 7435 / CECT 11047 / NRRL Y-11430 / Wegner 21-1) TaxID=981350 RepID=F2QQU2_KOMPC|nr:GQ67_01281T0 [Komagataella phaffii]AOA68050.1 GQ68_00109T0 [Komagataella phaffii GS115]CAH2447579.1 Actin-related protein 5 [Komagataella phaffii CBS 7435]CCA37770.1 Actin-related protein 5 [Komagataella phaffii CBS 7435]
MPGSEKELPPQKVYPLRDIPVSSHVAPFHSDYTPGVPIAIDFGKTSMRIGLVNKDSPTSVFPTVVSKSRDRKRNKMLILAGNDVYMEASNNKSNVKSPFDGQLITNWDSVETLLDYGFSHIGVSSPHGVENPIIINELLATPYMQRAGMYQLLFEAYNVPKVVSGVDAVFAYHYNTDSPNGLVIGTGHESTNVIPIVDGSAVLTYARRLDWGGNTAAQWLNSNISLKYPYFPSKISPQNAEYLVKDHCYVSTDYQKEISDYLTLETLEEKDRVIEASFVEVIKPQKTEEELQIEAEKRKESGRRLQEQARKQREEKLLQKEKEYEYYSALRANLEAGPRRDVLNSLVSEGFEDVEDFTKYLSGLEKSLKKARRQNALTGDGGEEEIEEPPSFPLIDIPDEQLDEDQIKEKRRQKLLKANMDARLKLKQEKEAAKLEELRKQEEDKKWRETDLNGWIKARRDRLTAILQSKKERKKRKEELSNRKSRTAQQRMKKIASLAADNNGKGDSNRKRRGGAVTIDNDPNDTFGANDDDWAIYRAISAGDDEEAEEEEEQELLEIEEALLEFDPTFTIEDTYKRQYDWRSSIVHRFLRGPRPYDPEEQHQAHQIHLNVERIRVPEVLFQPSIAGVDQAGVAELCEDTVLRRLPSMTGFSGDQQQELLQNVFISGGLSYFENFEERLRREFQSFLPVERNVVIRRVSDPFNDAWKGMAKWSSSQGAQTSYLTRGEYLEMGVDYIKENAMGCVKL